MEVGLTGRLEMLGTFDRDEDGFLGLLRGWIWRMTWRGCGGRGVSVCRFLSAARMMTCVPSDGSIA